MDEGIYEVGVDAKLDSTRPRCPKASSATGSERRTTAEVRFDHPKHVKAGARVSVTSSAASSSVRGLRHLDDGLTSLASWKLRRWVAFLRRVSDPR